MARESVDAYRKEQEERKINSLSDVIIDADEKRIAVMGDSIWRVYFVAAD